MTLTVAFTAAGVVPLLADDGTPLTDDDNVALTVEAAGVTVLAVSVNDTALTVSVNDE